MKNKKAQAAMEFLTTYGWAFLVIIVVISGLYYMGVFDTEKGLTPTCNIESIDLTCGSSYAVVNSNTGTLQLELKNMLSSPITIHSISIIESGKEGNPLILENSEATTLAVTPEAFCGDGKCEEGETCSTCPEDCGECDSSLDVELNQGTTTAIVSGFELTQTGPVGVETKLAEAGIATNVGKKAKFDITISYSVGDSTIVNTVTGTIITSVRRG